MSLTTLLMYMLLGVVLAIPALPVMRRIVAGRLGRRLWRNIPGSGWRPVFLKPYRP